jgi:SAM-dependent methyltransferase
LAKHFRGCSPVLDIGCGRGIFLQILAAAGIEAVGLDHSDEAVALCREKGFQVHREDAHRYLTRNEQRFGGIFCSHVIEHLAYEDALSLVKLCHSALRPDGVLLLLTPNPQDLAVISEVFWLDPTHVRPYPGPLLKSMLESVGLQVKIERYFLGDWRLVGRKNLPAYLLRRMLLGRYYGKSNTMILASKSTATTTAKNNGQPSST